MSPINRAPFNALVDDAGTGTTGTPWNKQQIKDVLLDPVDALTGGTWAAIPFDVANFWTGVTAGAVLKNFYTIVNTYTLHWVLAVYNVPLPPGGGTYISFKIPAGRALFAADAAMGKATLATDNGVEVPGIMVASNLGAAYLAVCKSNFAAWTGPTVTAYFTATVGLS